MQINTSPLFEPLTVKAKTLKNRVVMPPMVTLRGITSPEGIAWYGRHAEGGPGLVIVEVVPVAQFGAELTVETLTPLVTAIHAGGALAAIQILPIPRADRRAPAEIPTAEIESHVAQYRQAAQICIDAGFDGIEPHGAHGYLINRFFSPEKNQRDDEYGGDLAGRARYGNLIVREIRAVLDEAGSDMLILYRHTPIGPGYGIEDSLYMAEKLAESGVDILDISPASGDAPADRAEPFRGFGIPVIAVNDMDVVERALEALNAGRADLIAVARGLIADPDWPLKVKEGRLDEIVKCIKCDKKCFGNLRKGLPIACVQWAEGVWY